MLLRRRADPEEKAQGVILACQAILPWATLKWACIAARLIPSGDSFFFPFLPRLQTPEQMVEATVGENYCKSL